ncbi:MAG TPA: murein biosynthesis integral membrane protein MurJ [Bryobacteraceae bacterium]|nr:murein biosynthesis integral membrane protein MurJ [Bryobacteraceae bacterium]
MVESSPKRRRTGSGALLVATGILLSRLMGLVRLRVFAHFFGLHSDAADAFNAAFRIPNFLQNLFGEGVLSASFIPVYAGLLARGDEREAGRVAGAVIAILSLATSLLVLAGVAATPLLVHAIAPGFEGPKRELTIGIVRIMFPGAGLLVLSAWCLGILNSHRRFLLSYTAPVIWNVAMIVTLVAFGRGADLSFLATALAWGSVVGSGLMFAVQVPWVLRLVSCLRVRLDMHSGHVRVVLRSFVPVFIGRGVVQISAYIDVLLASPLPTGAVTGLFNAQLIYMLPVSLFGMAVSAAELPAMSRATGDADEVAAYLRQRLNGGLRQIAFFIVPSAMAFLALGDVVSAALLQTGRFTYGDSLYVWGILAGSAVGLFAATEGRLYASVFYSLRDTRTPLKYAVVHVVLATALGYVAAVHLPGWVGMAPRWGVAGLTISASIAAWVEFLLLRQRLNSRIGPTGLPLSYMAKLWTAAGAGAAAAWAVRLAIGTQHPLVWAAAILSPYGLVYFGTVFLFRLPEGRALLARGFRMIGR